jgi:hypothetical protein
VRLKRLYEDGELVVSVAPSDGELAEIVKSILSAKPATLRGLHRALAGLASEDRVRRVLRELIGRREVCVSSRVGAWTYSACTGLGGRAGSL